MSRAEVLARFRPVEPRGVRALSATPRIYVAHGFLAHSELEHVLALGAAAETAPPHRAMGKHDATGFSVELPVDGDRALERIRRRIQECAGLTNDHGRTMRFRRYRSGEGHPRHHDDYAIGRSVLVATALVWLTDTGDGGETRFPDARPRPLDIRPQRGGLLLWFNRTPNGQVDPAAEHEALAVRCGEKATITSFIYRPV